MRLLKEFSGACADIGITIPLVFVLSASTDFSLAWLLLGWGCAYIWSSWLFKVPVSIQPLKSMIVMTIALQLSVPTVVVAGLMFGLILLAIRTFGVLRVIQTFMSNGIVRGIQVLTGLGLGLIAIRLMLDNGITLASPPSAVSVLAIVTVVVGAIVLFASVTLRTILMLGLIVGGLVWSMLNSPQTISDLNTLNLIPTLWFEQISEIQWQYVGVLIVSQLPLTLANAVFAADQTYRDLGVENGPSAAQLCSNIGAMDIVLSGLGCFPTCHGSGGIAAHVQGGASSYFSTLILGCCYVLVAFFAGFGVADVLLGIPIAIFVVLLLADALRMVSFARHLQANRNWIVLTATVVAGAGFQNLAVGVFAGLIVHGAITYIEQRK